MWYVSSVIASCTLHSYLILFLTQIVIPIAVGIPAVYLIPNVYQTENLIDWENEGWYSERIDRDQYLFASPYLLALHFIVCNLSLSFHQMILSMTANITFMVSFFVLKTTPSPFFGTRSPPKGGRDKYLLSVGRGTVG
jgi:hypothetical protein